MRERAREALPSSPSFNDVNDAGIEDAALK